MDDAKGRTVALGFEEADLRRVEESFPALWGDGVVEAGWGRGTEEAIATGFLLGGVAGRERVEGLDGVEDNGAVANDWTDDPIVILG